MPKRIFVSLLAVVLLVAVAATPTPGQAALHARLDTFVDAGGETYFALSLQPDAPETPARGRDVVILLDTSASQAGDFRRDALNTLDGILERLSSGDRVELTAVDVHAVSMTRGFVAPDGPEMAKARRKLDRRIPLGSTDLAGALHAAADRFHAVSTDAGRARAAIYIGDGISAGNLTDTATYMKLVGRLLRERVPVSSCPVGPRVDRRLLGSLAGRTGGVVVEMGPEAASQLAAAAGASVYWPTEKVTWPAGMEVYPKRMPPLRNDRDTVLVGSYSGDGPANVRVTAAGLDRRNEFTWTVRTSKPSRERSYLKELVAWARVDGGASLPLVDSGSLEQARHAVNVGAYHIARLARQAMAGQDYEAAQRLADEVLRRDPNNPEARAIRRVIAAENHVAVAPPLDASPADLVLEGDVAAPGRLIATYAGHRRVVEQVIRAEVRNSVDGARREMARDPNRVIQDLKVMLEMVRGSREVNADVRNQLIGVLQAALHEAGRQRTELEHRRQRELEKITAAKERLLLHRDLLRKQRKVDQLMERFDSLLAEGRYRLAEEMAAAAAAEELPDHPVPVAATLLARTAGYHHEALQQRIARQKGVVETLGTVEKALLPMPDEPPIVFPPAAEWQELTARRTEKYRSMDVSRRRPAERRILEMLDSPTQIDFIETPLVDVLGFLEDLHEIEIEIDARALAEVGMHVETPITRHLKGISLRSALRLILRELDLTYAVRDEVLLITTPEEIEHLMTTKVYPVADLVVPIPEQSMPGGFGPLGGIGGAGNRGGDNPFGDNLFPQQNMQGPGQGIFNLPRRR